MFLAIIFVLTACLLTTQAVQPARTAFINKLTARLAKIDFTFQTIISILEALKTNAERDREKLSRVKNDVMRLDRDQQRSMTSLRKNEEKLDKLDVLVMKLKERHVCPIGWSRREGSCYKFTQCTSGMACSANHARTLCRKQGAELAAIESLQENNFVASLVDKSIISNVFIGGRDEVVEKRWEWPDGSIAKFTNWHRYQPDNCCGGQDCMVIWTRRGNKWDDCRCSYRYSARDTGYVCEKGITN